MKEKLYEIKEKLHDLREDFISPFTYLFIHFRFIYNTEIYPRKVEHHWCRFYDWVTKTEKEGWYVFDKRGNMIPWVHFDNGRLICLYEGMFTPVEK